MDEREWGRLEAKVDMLLTTMTEVKDTLKTDYARKDEVLPRLRALEQDKHKVWDKWIAFGTVGSLVVGVIALARTIH